ncbi:MAG: hypothetical protein JHC98_11600 [Thermoleophilaceae bacterium]|nr:hypothetical protein [Thermoleophilaceae bacterium]
MSNSHINKTIFAIVVALLLGIFSGCGGGDPEPAAGGPTPATAAPSAATQGATGSTAAQEGTDLAPVDVALDDGGFAGSTPPEYHVPSGFLVLITAKNVSDARIRLSVSAPSLAQTFKIAPGRTQTITLASIGAGESAKMISGGKTIKIVADAEPGP